MKNNLYIMMSFLVLTGLVSCEDDVDDIIPADAATISQNAQELQELLISESSDGKIWVSDPIENRSGVNYVTSSGFRDNTPLPPFFIGFDFAEDGTAKVYATINDVDQSQSDTEGSDINLKDNPNTYRVGGILRPELTFLSKGILSDMKRQGTFDFDFNVSAFNKDSIVLHPYFTQLSFDKIVFRPRELKPMQSFFEAAKYLHGGPSALLFFTQTYDFLPTVNSSWQFASFDMIETETEESKLSIPVMYLDYATVVPSYLGVLCNLLEQTYDRERDQYVFKLIAEDRLNAESGKAAAVTTFYDVFKAANIAYFYPISTSSDSPDGSEQLVLGTYAADGSEMGKYQITLTEL